jgi:non-heme chloroperoxidase
MGPLSFSDEFADFVGQVPLRELTLPFGPTEVWDLGDGPPLVLLHGVAAGRRVFFRSAPLLAQRYRVIVPHLRGETEPDGALSYEAMHDDIAALLSVLELDDVTLLGVSFGGNVALSYGARRDRRVRGIAAQGTFARYPMRGGLRAMLGLAALAPAPLASWWFRRRVLQGPESRYLREHMPGLDILNADWCGKTPFQTLRARAKLIVNTDRSEDIAKIDVPVALGHGKADRVVPMGCFRRLQQLCPDAKSVLWEDVPHLAPLTHPEALDELARLLE